MLFQMVQQNELLIYICQFLLTLSRSSVLGIFLPSASPTMSTPFCLSRAFCSSFTSPSTDLQQFTWLSVFNKRINRAIELTSDAPTNAGKHNTVHQTLHVCIASKIQNIKSFDWPSWRSALWLSNFLNYLGPNMVWGISYQYVNYDGKLSKSMKYPMKLGWEFQVTLWHI